MFCPYCGAQMPDGTPVCMVCGNKLPASSRPRPVQPAQPQPMQPTPPPMPAQQVPQRQTAPTQPYAAPPYPGHPVMQQPYPMQQAPVNQPKKKANLVPVLAVGGGTVLLVVILIVVLLIVTKGGTNYPAMKYAGQTYNYGDTVFLDPGRHELGEGTQILVRQDPDVGGRQIVLIAAQEGSTATIGGLHIGQSYRKVTSKYKNISADLYNSIDGTTIEGNPMERADYMLYIVDGKEYTATEYNQVMAEMMITDYEAMTQFRDNTFILSIRVEEGVITAIYAGDYRALFYMK